MNVQLKKAILILWIISIPSKVLFSQSQTSKDNYTGAWETPASWDPVWTLPQTTNIAGMSIIINGYITLNGSLSFSSSSSNLIINDTLVINGDLTLAANNNLTINANGILIIRGNLLLNGDFSITTNNYIVITGYIWKTGSNNIGSFVSNSNPTKVFVGAYVYPTAITNKPNFPALNCNAPTTTPYSHSGCSYGDMTDLLNDPIYPFFQSICNMVTPTITANGPTTFCSGGNVTLTSSAGIGYLWSNGATTQSVNITTSGSYTVKVSNANGCQSAASIATVVTVNALPARPIISASGPTTFCAGDSVTLTSSLATSYLWSNALTSRRIKVFTAGSYTLRVTNANGCQSVASLATIVTVNALPPPPTITTGGPTTFCAGDSVTLTSSTGTAYLWSNGASTQSINVKTSGSYAVRVSNTSGCMSTPSIATIVTVNSLPVTPTITTGGPANFCDGDSVTLSSNAATSYLWSNGATTQSINTAVSGSYTVMVTNPNGCQSAASIATIITVNALPLAAAGNNGPVCVGSTLSLTGEPSGMTSYSWTGPNGFASLLQNPTVSTPAALPMAGVYTLAVTNASGCYDSVAMSVVINALPVVNAGADTTIPNGTSTLINATVTGTGPFTYSWSPPGLFVNDSIIDPTTINLATTTVFTLTATSTTTTCSNTNAVMITISGGPLSSTPTASPGTICLGAGIELNAIASGGSGNYTYTWTSTPIGFTSSIANPIDSPTVNTTYNVAVFDGFTIVNSQISVIVNSLPANPTITAGGSTTFCAGDSVLLSSMVETSYLWSNGATTPSIYVSKSGSYTVQVTNVSGCQSAASIARTITVNALPVTPTITTGGPTAFCDGDSVTLTSSTAAGYIWSNAATIPSINVTSGGNYSVIGPGAASINVTSGGNYSVMVISADGCESAESVGTLVTVNALPAIPTITANGPTIFCTGDSVTLTSSTEASYLWSNGATMPTINITKTGTYTVLVTDANGCKSKASAATIVTVNNLPATPTIIASGPTTFCAGDSILLTSSSGTGYLWSNGAGSQKINVNLSDNYTVLVTDENRCQSAASTATTITVNDLPVTPIITAGGPTAFCAGDSVILVTDTESNYLWSNSASTQSININKSGSYTVQVTNASGCKSASSVATIVTVNSLPVVKAGFIVPVCIGSSFSLEGGPAGMTIYSWTGPNGFTSLLQNPLVSGNAAINMAGVYTLTDINASGCKDTGSTTGVINAAPIATASNTGPVCAGSPLSLTGGPAGMTTDSWSGPNGFTSLLQDPSVSNNATIAMAGMYTHKVTNASGCLDTASTLVVVNLLPSVNITSSNSSMCIYNVRTLTASPTGGTFLISDGPGNINGNILSATGSGIINLEYNYSGFCNNKATQSIIVNDYPVANAGPDQELKFVFETDMNAELSSSETGIWSLISGSGHIFDIHSPTTRVTELLNGENIFLWKVSNGNCDSSAEVKIYVYDPFIPSVITPNGDSKNEYFKISEIIGKVELIIFNRWGNVEYSNSNYINDWNGRNNKGRELPNDTYFYILKFENGTIKKGSVLIKR
jgi:gliding motility-associated-like protein